MDYIEQAFALAEDEKAQALLIYTQCVKRLVNKKYVMRQNDYFTHLSSMFGECWIFDGDFGSKCHLDAASYAKANVAFNYANLRLGSDGKFIKTAKSILPSHKRVNNKKLSEISESMNYLVMATTAEIWRQRCPYMH
jgi:hypothetical protein